MSFKVGDIVEEKVQVTDKMVRQFAEMSGDHNPMHLDDEYAKGTRFGRRIAHGMIAGALISRTMAMKLGPGGIYLSQNMKFVNPIFIDDVIIITLKVLSQRGKGIANIETMVHKENGDVVIKGDAMILQGEFV